MSKDERENLQKQPGAEKQMQKHQAIFHLDFETWEEIIETFDITESVIPHRIPDPAAAVGASGWYGWGVRGGLNINTEG